MEPRAPGPPGTALLLGAQPATQALAYLNGGKRDTAFALNHTQEPCLVVFPAIRNLRERKKREQNVTKAEQQIQPSAPSCSLPSFKRFSKETLVAQTVVAQLAGCCPATQKVTGSIPSQGTCLGFGPVPSWDEGEATNQCFSRTSMFLSPPSPLSKNELN